MTEVTCFAGRRTVMADILLRLENVSKVFKSKGTEFKAVDDVSFVMEKGENLAVIGESGSGKSTVARLITGIHTLSSGKVFFEGRDISELSKKERKEQYKSVQMVFQNAVSSFNPRRRIGTSLEEILINLCGEKKSGTREHAAELLKSVGLKEAYLDKYPHEISGGECQRAAIARAMSVNPKLLICDEATSALDVSAQAQIIELLGELRSAHEMSVLFISHDLPLVSGISDRVIIMDSGKIVEEGVTKDVITSPKSEQTKKLIEAVL